MEARVKRVLKRVFRVVMVIDGRVVRLLGGHRKFRPKTVDLEKFSVVEGLDMIRHVDAESYVKFRHISSLPFLARGYTFMRKKIFVLVYRLGKWVLK